MLLFASSAANTAGNGPMTREGQEQRNLESLLGRLKPEGHVREQLSGRHGEPALARSPLSESLEKPSRFQ